MAASFFESCLCWVVPLVFQGMRTPQLEESAVPSLPAELKMSSVGSAVEAAWKLEIAEAELKGRQPSLTRVLFQIGRVPIMVALLSGAINGLLCTCARPLLLRQLVLDTGDSAVALFLVSALAAELLLEAATTVLMRHHFADRFGAMFFAALAHLIFQKAVHVRTGHEGTPLALMGNDVPRVYEMLKQLAWVMSASVGLVGGVVVLIFTIGSASGVGIAILVAILATNAVITRLIKGAERGALSAAEKRIALVSRVINGIRAIKLSAWEEDFLMRVRELRRSECFYLRRYRILHIVTIQLGRMSPILAYFGSFIFLGLGSGLNPANVFTALVVFQGFRVSLIMIPASLVYWAQIQVSLRRVADFLLQPEVSPQVPIQNVDGKVHPSAAALIFDRAVFKWQERKQAEQPRADGFHLRVPTLCLEFGRSLGIIGHVGAGKSSFIMASLGDMVSISGRIAAAPKLQIGYVPQKPLIIAGTILDNILLGRSMDSARLAASIAGACLKQDLANMPDGLDTEIGERGVTLSGGQQQRVAIARALYTATPALLILDDPLAAVDPVVGASILCNVLARRTSGCAILMGLNQLSLIQNFDDVCVLADGVVMQHGAPTQLVAEAGPLRSLLEEAGQGSSTADAHAPSEQESLLASTTQNSNTILVHEESREKGAIKSAVFMQYLWSMGLHRFLFVCVLVLSAMACLASSDRWLASWVTASESLDGQSSETIHYVMVYSALTFSYAVSTVTASVALSFASVRASRSLHDDCMQRLLHAPTSFFEETPSGRIISRLAADLSTVDVLMPQFLDHGMQFVGALLQVSAIICVVAPAMLAVLAVAGSIYVLCVHAVDKANRELKRLANNAQSPVLSLLGEAFQGRLLLQATQCHYAFHAWFAERVDRLQSFTYTQTSVLHWGLLMSYMLSTVVSSSTAVFLIFLYGSDNSDKAILGLSLGYSLQLPYFLLHSCFVYLTFKTTLASLERLLECKSSGVPQEPAWRLPSDEALPASWPRGHVEFDNVELRYRQGLRPALKGVSFRVSAGERIGVVGRTGAGKSSLVVLLLRLREATSGCVKVDGKDLTTVGLHVLRERMAVIPQESLLLEGTVRNNIDPFNQHGTEELVKVLEKVGFPAPLLEQQISAGGQSLSQGQHQLLALARALLRQARIVILDEPTSSVDAATDARIQKALREELRDCTVFTIAHRMATIIDSDRVMVMDSGCLVEFGTPAELHGKGEIFSGLLRAAGLDLPAKTWTVRTVFGRGRSALETRHTERGCLGETCTEAVKLEIPPTPTCLGRAASSVRCLPW